MKAPAAVSIMAVGGVELAVLLLRQRQLLLPISGVAMAFLMLDIRRLLTARSIDRHRGRDDSAATGDALHQWISGTETRIRWSESTRADWDRRWRPVLARRFETVTGQRPAKDRAAFDAAGRMLFGAELWEWVDPGNVAPVGGQEPGPGRAVLEEILQRLERR